MIPSDNYKRFVVQLVDREKRLMPSDTLALLRTAAMRNLAQRGAIVLRDSSLQAEIDGLLSERLNLPGYETWLKRRREEEGWPLDPS